MPSDPNASTSGTGSTVEPKTEQSSAMTENKEEASASTADANQPVKMGDNAAMTTSVAVKNADTACKL